MCAKNYRYTCPSAHCLPGCYFCFFMHYQNSHCCFTFQVDIPTLIIENVGKEGLKHLEMYLSAKEKGMCNSVVMVFLVKVNRSLKYLLFL